MIDRYLDPQVREMMGISRVVTVVGARQVGKTTLVQALGDSLPSVEFRSLDDQTLLAAAHEDPKNFVASESGTTIIDELQRAPELLLSIKQRVDQDNRPGQYLLTGSADLINLRTTPDTLPGRNIYVRLFGLSQAEIMGHPRPTRTIIDRWFDGDISSSNHDRTGAQALMPLIAAGGYPDVVGRPYESARILLDSYVEASVGRYVDEIARVDSKKHLGQVLSAVATRSSSTLNVTELGRDLGVNRLTVDRYLRILADMFLIELLPSWSRNIDKRQSKPPKAYVADSAMMAGLLGVNPIDLDLIREGPIAGALVESFAVAELMKVNSYSRSDSRFFHYRDTRGREIDVVLERPNLDVVAIEIKKSATIRADDFRAIDFLAERIGSQLKAGIILHTGEDLVQFGERKAAVPISALWADHSDK